MVHYRRTLRARVYRMMVSKGNHPQMASFQLFVMHSSLIVALPAHQKKVIDCTKPWEFTF